MSQPGSRLAIPWALGCRPFARLTPKQARDRLALVVRRRAYEKAHRTDRSETGTPVNADPPAKIHWAPRLRPQLLKQLYESDAKGIQDLELCDEVGMILYMRCRTYLLVQRHEVECPLCHTVFQVAGQGDGYGPSETHCPNEDCTWSTTRATYSQSIRNHYALPGRAMDAFQTFYERFPLARTYRAKMLLIDQLIHQFHIDEKTGGAVKSIASRLFEGNKKDVVRFLDELSALDPGEKQAWRRTVATTIDRYTLRSDPETET